MSGPTLFLSAFVLINYRLKLAGKTVLFQDFSNDSELNSVFFGSLLDFMKNIKGTKSPQQALTDMQELEFETKCTSREIKYK